MTGNDKKPPSQRSEPREHHYLFAHYIVREVCEQDPLQFFALIESPERYKFVDWLWESTTQQVGKPIEDFDPAALSLTIRKVKDYPAIIFKMPPPKAVAEVHFVAVLLTSAPASEADDRQASFRYFTLEYGNSDDGMERTVLCEWAQGTHCNLGNGPSAAAGEFIDAIGRRI